MTGKNIAASVRQRLRNLAQTREEDFQYLLTRYALERLLFRLAESEYANQFVLKGACLFELWTDTPHRATRDVDLLGFGSNDIRNMETVFRNICSTAVADDGIRFQPSTVSGSRIKEEQQYEGMRIQMTAMLERAKVAVQIDIGFGDVITPQPEEVNYPTLLTFPAPHIRAYPKETVVAEKFQAMVDLGLPNSRMKDFFDLDAMARMFAFDGSLLANAIAATFFRRKTDIPTEAPTALTSRFAADETKNVQWQAFLKKSNLNSLDLATVIERLATFLLPVARAAAAKTPFDKQWPAGGPWSA